MKFRHLLTLPLTHILLVFLAALLLYTTNLAGQYFTLDEPGTVSQAESIHFFGYTAGWDGRNLLSDNNGREYNIPGGSYFWTWQPPIQSLTAYIGSAVFGKTVFGYRFFFTVFGALTVALIYYLSTLLFTKRWVSYLVTLQVLLTLPFFLYVRQVRYYAPSAFFATVLLYVFIKAWKNEVGKRELVILFLASTLLFFTNYFVWAGSIASVGLVFLYQRQKAGVMTIALSFLLPLWWFLQFRPFAGDPTGAYIREMNRLIQFSRYLPYIHSYLFPFFFVPLIFLGKRVPLLVYGFVGIILIKLVIYSFLLDTHGRYLIDIMPVLILLFGFLYQSLATTRTKVLIPVVALSMLLIANYGSLFPKAVVEPVEIIATPRALGIELLDQYPSIVLPISNYLSTSYQDGDIFWANNYRNTIYITSSIPHFTPVCDLKTQTPLGPDGVTNRERIKWFIFFQHDSRLPQTLDKQPCLGEKWQQRLETEYDKTSFTVPPGYYLINDPDIVGRSFPPTEARPDEVIIYQKKSFYAQSDHLLTGR